MKKSYDTSIKHYIRLGLFDNLPDELRSNIPTSNYYRWKNEPEDKYLVCEVAQYINQEIDLIKRVGNSSLTKKTLEAYFHLVDTFHSVCDSVKGIKTVIAQNKEVVVNAIEKVKAYISVDNALKVFGISRATFQNYKTLVLNSCDSSYFKWCVRHYPQQLLKSEIAQIKKYLTLDTYKYWSKSSVYIQAVRDKAVSCSLATWYKYSRLLGFGKRVFTKPKNKKALVTLAPNEMWCADITVFKTADQVKHYIHVLMDHFSKKILAYKIHSSVSAGVIVQLLQSSFKTYKPNKPVSFLSDGGSENVNTFVQELLAIQNPSIQQLIALKDIPFSNSKIEMLHKVLKYQFLFPLDIQNGNHLEKVLVESVSIYNSVKPQWSLAGNTPDESYFGNPLNFSQFTMHFNEQKQVRIKQNQQNYCKVCLKN